MTKNELFYTLALLKVEGVGDVIAKKLIERFNTAENVFQCSKQDLKSVENVGQKILKSITNKSIFLESEKELRFIEEEGIEVLCYRGSKYPERLKNCYDAPVLLFQTGDINWFDQKIISVVGTRKMTSYGSKMIHNVLEDLKVLHPVIVSGFAFGVDIFAHQTAMDFGLQTIGVLAHGLNQIYPREHKKYMPLIEKNGGFLTEFWSNSMPDRKNFVRRNRIVAGLSEATIVVESAEKGGSLITAQFASDYDNEVFAIPGRATDTYSQGCNNLIKTNRAHLLTCAADLLYHLNWDLKPKKQEKIIQKELFVSLTEEEKLVCDLLAKIESEDMDSIAMQLSLPVYKVSSVLMALEIKNILHKLPGKRFQLV